MINTSIEYQKAILDNHFFTARIICTLKNGTQLKFDETNLRADGVKISDAVSGTNNFEIFTPSALRLVSSNLTCLPFFKVQIIRAVKK